MAAVYENGELKAVYVETNIISIRYATRFSSLHWMNVQGTQYMLYPLKNKLFMMFQIFYLLFYSRGSIDIKYNQTFKTESNDSVIEVNDTIVMETFEERIKELEDHPPKDIQGLVDTFNITHVQIRLRGDKAL